jgi:serine/threonine protein kinase
MMMTLSPGEALEGHYRILEKIGEGGFGVVYKAYDWHRNSLVAIKQINMAALSVQEKIEATDSFNREVTLLSRLDHESLPHIYNHFTDPEHWYVVMDYIEGRTLEDVLSSRRDGRLPIQRVIAIGIKLCNVLDYLHAQNPPVIFRDVKPGNIMITSSGQVYLIDFGVARRFQAGKRKDTIPLGSPGYAAPEQYGKAQTTPQTDIYGLGATLQTLLTGREPLEIRMHGLPTNHRIPWELQALLLRMMEDDSSKRPHNMAEVRRALEALNVSPLHRLKESPLVRAINTKLSRRVKTLIILGIAMIILEVLTFLLFGSRIVDVNSQSRFLTWLFIFISMLIIGSPALILAWLLTTQVIGPAVIKCAQLCARIFFYLYRLLTALIVSLMRFRRVRGHTRASSAQQFRSGPASQAGQDAAFQPKFVPSYQRRRRKRRRSMPPPLQQQRP